MDEVMIHEWDMTLGNLDLPLIENIVKLLSVKLRVDKVKGSSPDPRVAEDQEKVRVHAAHPPLFVSFIGHLYPLPFTLYPLPFTLCLVSNAVVDWWHV